jgi:hypothetical protein
MTLGSARIDHSEDQNQSWHLSQSMSIVRVAEPDPQKKS